MIVMGGLCSWSLERRQVSQSNTRLTAYLFKLCRTEDSDLSHITRKNVCQDKKNSRNAIRKGRNEAASVLLTSNEGAEKRQRLCMLPACTGTQAPSPIATRSRDLRPLSPPLSLRPKQSLTCNPIIPLISQPLNTNALLFRLLPPC